jgi:hypothetical protein
MKVSMRLIVATSAAVFLCGCPGSKDDASKPIDTQNNPSPTIEPATPTETPPVTPAPTPPPATVPNDSGQIGISGKAAAASRRHILNDSGQISTQVQKTGTRR